MKKRLPRKLKKRTKNGRVLIYDLRSMPKGMAIKEMMYGIQKRGVCIYDTTEGGEAPRIMEGVIKKGNTKNWPYKIEFLDLKK